MATHHQIHWLGLILVGGLCGCGAAPVAEPARDPHVDAKEPQDLARLPLTAMALRPLTAGEQELEAELRADVAEVLSAGERHSGNDWGLAVITDSLASRLEALDLAVDREGFVGSDGALAQNLVVTLRGSLPEPPMVVVGARFDSLPGSPGADDNATGVAALLALARHFKDKPRQRTLRLVWFSDASQRREPEHMGAWQHLEHVVGGRKTPGADEPPLKPPALHACVELHGLGVYSDAQGSQRYPDGMPVGHPIAEFVEVAAMVQDSALGSEFAHAMGRASSVPIRGVTWVEPTASVAMTAFRAFTEHGCPALLVSDTQTRRFAGFGTKDDTADKLDFGRLARAVEALTSGVELLLNAPSFVSTEVTPGTAPDEPASGS